MSKQDGYASRTAADLERKYNFGQTFAEVYGLVKDAQRAAEEAQSAFDGLNQEQIFNLLTNYGEAQGIYRDDNGDVYVNASYIKSGKLAAEFIDVENLKVSSANIVGELVATQIDTKDLKVAAANITGTLTAGQIDATNLKVSATNITGTLAIGQLPDTVAKTSDIPTSTSDLTNDSGYQTASGVTTIVRGVVTTDYVNALGISVDAANVKGTLTIGQLPGTVAKTSDIPTYTSQLNNNSGYLNESGVTTIVNGIVTADYVNALGVYASVLQSEGSRAWQTVTIEDGVIDFYSGSIRDLDYGTLCMSASLLTFECEDEIRFYMPNGRYFAFSNGDLSYYDDDGSVISTAVFQ